MSSLAEIMLDPCQDGRADAAGSRGRPSWISHFISNRHTAVSWCEKKDDGIGPGYVFSEALILYDTMKILQDVGWFSTQY